MIYWYWNILKYIVDRWIFSNSKNRRGHSYKGTMNRGNPLEVSPSISGSPWKIPWKNPTLGTLGFPVLGLKKTQLFNIWRLENNPWIDQATRFFLNWVKTTCDAFAVNIYLLSRWHHGGLSAGVNCTFLWLIIMFPLNPAISWGLNRSKHTMFRLTQLGNCRYGYGSNTSTAIFSNGASNKTLSGGDSRGRGTGTSGDCKESHSWWWDDMGWPYMPHWSHVIWPWHPLGAKNKDPSHIPTFLWFCLSRLDWLKGKSAGSQMEKKAWFPEFIATLPWNHLILPLSLSAQAAQLLLAESRREDAEVRAVRPDRLISPGRTFTPKNHHEGLLTYQLWVQLHFSFSNLRPGDPHIFFIFVETIQFDLPIIPSKKYIEIC